MDKAALPNISNRLATSVIDTSKHSFAIRPFVPTKKRPATSHSTSPLVNRSEERTNNGSKSLRARKQLLNSERNKQSQLIEIRNELFRAQDNYKNLKKAFKKLRGEYEASEESTKELVRENLKLREEVEEVRQQSVFYHQQFERIKRECLKLLEIQGFKNKKMEQTLQEKELMIQYLKNQLTPGSPPETNPTPSYNLHNSILNPPPHKYNSTANNSNLSLASLQDILTLQATQKDRFIHSISERDESNISLNFSKDRSKLISQALNSCSPSFENDRKLSNIHHHHSSVGSFENISFSLNNPDPAKFSLGENQEKEEGKGKGKEKEKDKGFKKRKVLEIDVDDALTMQDSRENRKESCAAKTKRRKSETEEKIRCEMSMRVKYENMKDRRLGAGNLR